MQSQKYQQACKLIPHISSMQGFQRFIANSSENKMDLFEQIRACKLDKHKIRFNVWRMEVNIISVDNSLSDKTQELQKSRATYQERHFEAFNGIGSVKKKETGLSKNPLMKAMMKPDKVDTNTDEFLRQQIQKDVERTYQEMEFFQNESILKLLSVVLFVWCKRNPEVSYKQGMNQILASIVYIYFRQTYTSNVKPEGWDSAQQELKNTFKLFNSIDYAEADIYNVFEKVMNIQQDMYKTQTDSSLKGNINPNSKNNTPILQRIINLTDHKLKALDLELFRAIKLQDVRTKTFLLRWIRCMHTRQFSLDSSFVLWDSIFLDYYEWPGSKEKNQFQFIDAMCLAMFIYMRSLVLTRETSNEILQIYQKYPQIKLGGYLEELVTIAWSVCEALRNPNNGESDWYGSQSTQNNAKLQFLKSKEGKVEQTSKPEPSPKKVEGKKEKEFPKSPNSLFGNSLTKNDEVKEKPIEVIEPVKPTEEKVKVQEEPKKQIPILFPKREPLSNPVVKKEQSKNGEQKKTENNKFSIVLEAEEWQQLQNELKKALKKQQNWVGCCEKSLQVLEKKIEFTRRKLL